MTEGLRSGGREVGREQEGMEGGTEGQNVARRESVTVYCKCALASVIVQCLQRSWPSVPVSHSKQLCHSTHTQTVHLYRLYVSHTYADRLCPTP